MKIPAAILSRINPSVKALLKSRFHSLMSKDVMLITFTGRLSGRSYTTPVSYIREGQTVRCFSHSDILWWRNLRGGASVSLRIQGEDYEGDAEAIAGDPKLIADSLTAFMTRLPRDAPNYDIEIDSNRLPISADVERAAHDSVLVEIALTASY